jgi:hypothetical protein
VGAAASLFNTAVLAADGELYLLGSNGSCLLARRQQQQQPEGSCTAADAAGTATAAGQQECGEDVSWAPVCVDALEMHPLVHVALGGQHALVTTQQVCEEGLQLVGGLGGGVQGGWWVFRGWFEG